MVVVSGANEEESGWCLKPEVRVASCVWDDVSLTGPAGRDVGVDSRSPGVYITSLGVGVGFPIHEGFVPCVG